jgi:hypothetical protein
MFERYLYHRASPVADDAATGTPPPILTAPPRLLPLRSLGAHVVASWHITIHPPAEQGMALRTNVGLKPAILHS